MCYGCPPLTGAGPGRAPPLGPGLRHQPRRLPPLSPRLHQPLDTPEVGGGGSGRAHASRERCRPPPFGCGRGGGALVRRHAPPHRAASLPQHLLATRRRNGSVQVPASPLSGPNWAHPLHSPLCHTGGWAPIEAAAARQGTHVVYVWHLLQRRRCCSPAGGLVLGPLAPLALEHMASSLRCMAGMPAPPLHTRPKS